MTRAILRQSVREAYLTADRVIQMAADEIDGLITRWRDWDALGIARLMLQVRSRVQAIWLAWMPYALGAHLGQVRDRTLVLVADVALQARIARTVPGVRSSLLWRLERQVQWVTATVERIVRSVTIAPDVEGQAVAGAVSRFLHPRFAQVRYQRAGHVRRRFGSSGAYAGTYARTLFRQAAVEVYGETMGAIAKGDPLVIGERWRLSPSHGSEADECDAKADADNYGLGRGVYRVGQFPVYPSHVGCLCHRELVRAEMVAA